MKKLAMWIICICLIGTALGAKPKEKLEPASEIQKYAEMYCGHWTVSGQTEESPLGPAMQWNTKVSTHSIVNGFAVTADHVERNVHQANPHLEEIVWYDSKRKSLAFLSIFNDGRTLSGTGKLGDVCRWVGNMSDGDGSHKMRVTDTHAPNGKSFVREARIPIDGKKWGPLFKAKFTKSKEQGSMPIKVGNTSVEKELIKLEYNLSTAVVEKNMDLLDRIISDHIIFGTPDGTFGTKQEGLEFVGSDDFQLTSMSPEDLTVRTYGDMAVVTGTSIVAGEEGKTHKDIFTDTFLKRDGRWQMVASHASHKQTSVPLAKSGQLLAFRVAKPKPDIDLNAFEEFATDIYAPTWRKHAPGMKCFLIKGERGNNKGAYLDVWTFDSAQIRNAYFPKEGEGASETGQEILANVPELNYEKYFQATETQVDYTDYVVLGQGRSISGSQILALRPIELKSGVDTASFEKFATDVFAPAWERHAPGMKGFFIKGERGKEKGQYRHIWIFDSIETRNFYYPTEGGDASELGLKFLSNLPDFNLDKYLEDSDADVYTDYIVME